MKRITSRFEGYIVNVICNPDNNKLKEADLNYSCHFYCGNKTMVNMKYWIEIPPRSIMIYSLHFSTLRELFANEPLVIGFMYHEIAHDYTKDENAAWDIAEEICPEKHNKIVKAARANAMIVKQKYGIKA